eukprot:scpid10104/ scgid23340/ Mediator of RNA polymerase II transcription subunit 14; Mediator complex subunit 14
MELQKPGVSLGQLLDNMLQKTYHDLSVLAELLPRKHDMERKIEIVKFATRIRKQFIRLLALVKWANSSRCIEQCQEVTNFFEKQSMFCASTADQLHHLAKGTLVAARLPNFSLPVAVDVLATGTYSRLPACLKDKIIPECPLSPTTDQSTKDNLESIIYQRLLADGLPKELFDLSVDDGRVTFVVHDEFEVALTVVSSDFALPWRLLSLKILVKDPERPKDTLVLPEQVDFLHRLAQAQLFVPDSNPLMEMYKLLHSFTVSLQLEVLHSQARRLMEDNPRQCAGITSYRPASELSFEYWKPPTAPSSSTGTAPTSSASSQQTTAAADKPASEHCQLRVCVENSEADTSSLPRLSVVHTPALPTVDIKSGDCHRWQPLAINLGHLSIEALLRHAVEVRSVARLHHLYNYLRQFRLYSDRLCLDADSLQLLLELNDFPSAKLSLLIVLDSQVGTFSAKLLPSDPMRLVESLGINHLLNRQLSTELLSQVDRLRARSVLCRCKQQMQSRGWNVYTRLPMAPVSASVLAKLGPDHIFIKLALHHICFLVIEIVSPKSGVASSLDLRCHLLQTGPVPYGLQSTATSSGSSTSSSSDQQPGFLNAQLSPLDASLYIGKSIDDCPTLAHGPRRKVPCLLGEHSIDTAQLRVGEVNVPARRIIPDVQWIDLLCDLTEDLVPFSTMLTQLSSAGFSHAHLRVDRELGISIHITRFPTVPNFSESAARLSESLLSCQVVAPFSRNATYVAIFQFLDCPVESSVLHEKTSVRRLVQHIPQGQPPTTFLQHFWSSLVQLYSSVLEFSAYYSDKSCDTFSQCAVVSFNYRSLVLAYGPAFRFRVVITLKQLHFRLEFQVLVESIRQKVVAERPHGSVPPDYREARLAVRNPHSFLGDWLSTRLSGTRSIPLIVQGLHHTLPPLLAMSNLSAIPDLSVSETERQPRKHISVHARSPTSFLLIYRGVYHIEVQMKMDGVLLVRDCGYSARAKAQNASPVQPVPHLKDFILLFMAANHPNRGALSFGAPGKFVVGSNMAGLFTPTIPLTPTIDMSAEQATALSASSTVMKSEPSVVTSCAAATGAAAVGTNGVIDDIDVSALIRDLHAGATTGSSTDSPRPPPSTEALANLDDVTAATPGGTSILDMFSPSFVDSSPGNMAAPSPATIKAITGMKPISVNSPALPWAHNTPDAADFSAAAGTGADSVMDVGYDSGWNMQWSLNDGTGDANLMDVLSTDALGVQATQPRAASTVLSPPPLGLPSLPAASSTAAATASLTEQTATVTQQGHTSAQASQQAHLSSQVSVSYASRRPSIAVTVAETAPPVSTVEERITPPEHIRKIIARQKGSESRSSWEASSPTLINHRCWFELLRERSVSSSDSPVAAALLAKGESQDSGIGSMESVDLKLTEENRSEFWTSPLEGFLTSSHLFQQWRGVVQDAALQFHEVTSQPLSLTVAADNGLQCRIWLDLNWPFMLQAALEVSATTSTSEAAAATTATASVSGNSIKADDLQVIEKLFMLRVSRPPYRHNALVSFARLITLKKELLEDVVQILHMGMKPDLSLPWRPELCLVTPPSVCCPPLATPGGPAIACTSKLLILVNLQATDVNTAYTQSMDAARPVVLPFVFDPAANTVEYKDFASSTESNSLPTTPIAPLSFNKRVSNAVKEAMTAWQSQRDSAATDQSYLSSAIRHLCTSLHLAAADQ